MAMDKQSNKKKKVKKAEVVANCDRFKEVVANSFLESDQRSSGDNQQLAVTNCDLRRFNITKCDFKEWTWTAS
jgi:hypothetical protein